MKKLINKKMKNYIGTKSIKARPITRQEYLDYRGWELPEGENPNDELYLVEYEVDPLSPPNHPDHEGYITMSPKHVFEKAYKPSDTFEDRLYIEWEELGKKIDKLKDALDNKTVPTSEVEILELQMSSMIGYENTLDERIQRLK